MADDYKDIIVHLDDAEGCDARVEVAAQIARRFDAHLTGMAVEHAELRSSHMAMPLVPFLRDELRQRETHRLQRLKELFDGAVAKTSLVTEWRGAPAPLIATLTRAAHHADLLVMGQEVDNESVHGDGGTLGPVVMSAGIPVLAVPYIGVAREPGKRVLVAWNGSRESIRATHDALPLLKQADAVEVVSIESPGHQANDTASATDAAQHLTRLGVSATARTLVSGEIDPANLLLSHVSDSDADLLVMGAYGHSRLREFFLGGVTKEIFKSMTVPVLLSH